MPELGIASLLPMMLGALIFGFGGLCCIAAAYLGYRIGRYEGELQSSRALSPQTTTIEEPSPEPSAPITENGDTAAGSLSMGSHSSTEPATRCVVATPRVPRYPEHVHIVLSREVYHCHIGCPALLSAQPANREKRRRCRSCCYDSGDA